jgi:hypothetical protein
MNDRSTKRRRLNPFVDIEAVGEGEDSDEEMAQAEGVSSGFAFPAPTHILVTPDVSEDDASEDEADLHVTFPALQNVLQDAQHAQQWDSFLTSVLNRGRRYDIPISGQERLPSGEDCLWEIGCAVSGLSR